MEKYESINCLLFQARRKSWSRRYSDAAGRQYGDGGNDPAEDHEGGIVSNRPRAGLSERILSLHRPCKAGSAAQGTAGTKAMRYRQSMHWMEMPISGIKMLM